MAEARKQVAIPESTDTLLEILSEKLDETKGKIVKKAVEAFAKKEGV